MIILKIAAITAIVLVILFIKPLTAYYNWSGSRRKKRKEKQKEKQQG